MKRNILVTGGAGYIGSHACKALAEAGFLPVTLDNLVHGHADAVRWGPLVPADLNDDEILLETLQRFSIAGVMHFAALIEVGASMRAPEEFLRNNVTGSFNLLDAMRKAGVRPIVFSSTCATYGLPERMPIDEGTPQRPINAYGETKLMVERALHWHAHAHNVRYAALRYFNAAGADPSGEIGERHNPETHLIPLVLDAAMGTRAQIDIFGVDYPTPDGTAVRDYIHVGDLAAAHVKAIEHLLEGGDSLQLNLGTGRGYSVREVVAAVGRVTGRQVPFREMPRRAGDPPMLVADPSRANRLLAWRPALSDIDTIVRTAWRHRYPHAQTAARAAA
jgi:UDP-glucose-4-epimerase GalE